MKKSLFYLIISVVLTSISSPVYAANLQQHDSKEIEQVFNNFLMELCHVEVKKAVKNFIKMIQSE